MDLNPLKLPDGKEIPLRLPPMSQRSAIQNALVTNRESNMIEVYLQFAAVGLCAVGEMPWASLAKCEYDLVRFGRGVAEHLERDVTGEQWSGLVASSYALCILIMASLAPPSRKEVEAARRPFEETKAPGSKPGSSSRSRTKGRRSAG